MLLAEKRLGEGEGEGLKKNLRREYHKDEKNRTG